MQKTSQRFSALFFIRRAVEGGEGITLRELLEACKANTDCEVWLDETLANRYFSVITGTAHALLHRTDVPILDCRVYAVDAEGGRLVIQLMEEETDEAD